MALRRVAFLRRCAGLPAAPPPPSRPSVLLVYRPYGDGRSILGIDDVADRLRRALPAGVSVRLYLPRGDAGLHEQAAAFSAATVVVAPHGAATANFNFLPHDAVALGVFALRGRFGHDEAVAASLPSPPYNVTVRPVDCSASSEARTAAAKALPAFQALDLEAQGELLAQRHMSTAFASRVHELLGMSLLDWMQYRAYRPDPEELTQAVLGALALREEKAAERQMRRQRERQQQRQQAAGAEAAEDQASVEGWDG